MATVRSRALGLALTLTLAGAAGCASARMSDHETDQLFRQGRYDQAAERLRKGLQDQGEDGRDRLLYLLDLGLSLHSGGKYAESNRAFLEADKLAEIKDYTSLSKEGATLLVSDNAKGYKGEDFEKVLINVYLAMNYALLGDNENALVEARRVNQKLYLMVSEGQRKYKQNAFARYLSAILYEADGNPNDAYVDYKNTYSLKPDFPGLGRDLWRVAGALGMEDEQDSWGEKFHLTDEDHRIAKAAGPRSGKAEIIVLYENGLSPAKHPNPQFQQLPIFRARYNPVNAARVEAHAVVGSGASAGARPGPGVSGQTAVLESIEHTAIENLHEKYAGLVGKKVAGMVAKGAVGYGIAKLTHDDALGELAGYLLFAADQADLRSWSLLPRDLQVARLAVDPGTYQVHVQPDGMAELPVQTVQVGRGKKAFVDFRFTP